MVEIKRGSKSRSASSSSSASSGSSSSGSSSGTGSSSGSSGTNSSSGSSSSPSRSASPKHRTSRARDERRPVAARRSRSPRRSTGARADRRVPLPQRRSPSPVRRRSPERKRRTRSRSPVPPRRVTARGDSPRRAASPPPEPKRMAVRNLSRNLTKEHLSEIFGIYGTLKSCEMPADRVHTHINRGYGYVEYDKAEDAEKAMKHMHGGQIDGLEIECELTIPFRNAATNGGSGSRRRSPPPPSRGARAISPRGRLPPLRGRSPSRRSGRRGSPRTITGANSIPLGRRSRSRSSRR